MYVFKKMVVMATMMSNEVNIRNHTYFILHVYDGSVPQEYIFSNANTGDNVINKYVPAHITRKKNT